MFDTIHVELPNVRLVAHRGCSGLEKENTASAFVAAANRSYFAIETDVHVTADGQFILIHDENTKRVAGDELIVENTRFDTLRALRLPDVDGSTRRKDLMLPTLEEYVHICRKYEKFSVLELKNHFEPVYIEKVLGLLREMDQLAHTIFISFNLPNLLCLREMLPDHPMQYLTKAVTDEIMETLLENRLDLNTRFDALKEEHIRFLHEHGRQVNTWTVNDPETALRLASWGIDFITTNILEDPVNAQKN